MVGMLHVSWSGEPRVSEKVAPAQEVLGWGAPVEEVAGKRLSWR